MCSGDSARADFGNQAGGEPSPRLSASAPVSWHIFAIDHRSDHNLRMPFQRRSLGISLRALIVCSVISSSCGFGQTEHAKLFEREDAYIRSEVVSLFSGVRPGWN